MQLTVNLVPRSYRVSEMLDNRLAVEGLGTRLVNSLRYMHVRTYSVYL